ncbi:MAG: CDGSH iron-sulfur domain-containing protein [Planctomycetes bacterium]|nr:CDGSH iron-sulfur domain-containing protein [Planctomycetota bacterium]
MPDPAIYLCLNGPLKVEGPVRLVDHQGKEFNLQGKDTYWVCRCGASGNKPFCDGSHKKNNFKAEQAAR